MNINKTTTTQYSLYLLLSAPLLLTACGGGSDDGESSDTTAPTVSSTTPVDGTTGVARDSTITAKFNEDMFAVTVDAASLTLAKSGSENISGTVSFDGASNVASLVPDNRLAILSTYTATLTTAVTDLSGNGLAANHSWSFTTADGAWGSSAELVGNRVGDPQIAIDSRGNALAVWQQFDDTNHNIMANHFDGNNWGSAVLIENNDFAAAYKPQIAFDSNGNALAVWQQNNGTHSSIYVNRFDGNNWRGAELIGSYNNAGSGYNPQIALNSDGNALVMWTQDDDSTLLGSLYASRFNGERWGSAVPVGSDNAGDARASQIAIDSDGNALAVWQQVNGANYSVMANHFDGSNWGSAVLIESDNAESAGAPQIAFDSSGNALAVWAEYDGTRVNIYANRFDGSNWGGAVLIGNNNAGSAYKPQIAFDSSGNALVVWQQYDGTRNSIYANRFNGSSWGGAVLIENNNAEDARNPQIAVDSSGNALAVWHQDDGTLSNIYANRFNGSNWGSAKLIKSDNFGDVRNPQITIDSSGNALVVWEQFDGTRFSLYTKRFE